MVAGRLSDAWMQGYWRWNAWALIAIGIVQAVAGVATTLFFNHGTQNSSNGLGALLLFF